MRSAAGGQGIGVITVALMVVGIACSSGDPELPDTNGAALWAFLQDAEYQQQWELWPGKGELYEGGEPHGALFTTYLNPIAFEALTEKAGSMPHGSMILKENYTADRVFDLVTVMYKVDGYNPDNNDWFWAKIKADGTVDAEGQVRGCQACHSQGADNDFVLTGGLR